MPANSEDPSVPSILIVGASRGLGHAMAAAFLKHGWRVVGTLRGPGTPLHALAAEAGGRLEIETLDIDAADQIAALRGRLAGRRFDILFVNAGITTRDPLALAGEVTTEEFTRVMITNAWSPMRVIEALADLTPAAGLIGAMSSGQGSVANNESGLREVYRSSKAALNMFMRSFAARPANAARSMVVMAPGWVRTDLGGPHGRLGIEDSVPRLVEVLLGKLGKPGLEYLDYLGRTVPW